MAVPPAERLVIAMSSPALFDFEEENRVFDAEDDHAQSLRAGRQAGALSIWLDALGLTGKADVVAFGSDGTSCPVGYEHGWRHRTADNAHCDDIQVAAQAPCLEAMTGHALSIHRVDPLRIVKAPPRGSMPFGMERNNHS